MCGSQIAFPQKPARLLKYLSNGLVGRLLVLAGEPLPSGLTAPPDSPPDLPPRHLVFPQYVDRALQLVFGLLQAGCVDAKLVQQHFRHLAIGPYREFTALSFRLKNLIAKLHAL